MTQCRRRNAQFGGGFGKALMRATARKAWRSLTLVLAIAEFFSKLHEDYAY
jgi:hypothetical protein